MLDSMAQHGYVAVSAAATDNLNLQAVYVMTAGTMTFRDAAGTTHSAVPLVAGTYFYGPIRAVTALTATVLGVRNSKIDPLQ